MFFRLQLRASHVAKKQLIKKQPLNLQKLVQLKKKQKKLAKSNLKLYK